MVSTACPEATAVGAKVLERGGNAVDAAIAVGFALAVTYPTAGNIGGGGFFLVRTKEGETNFIDFREKAPLGASEKMYLDRWGKVVPQSSTLGHRAVGVPGTVSGLYKAYSLYATLSWEELVAPAIDLAEKGFPVNQELARSLRKLRKYMEEYPGLKKFQRPDGKPFLAENIFYQPQLAATLSRIAAGGPAEFYSGETARLIAREMEKGGGLITLDDLKRYRSVFREPVSGSYRGNQIISAPPPSSGGTVLLEILNILEGYEFSGQEFFSAPVVHRMIEAEKIAYADRARYLGDPDFIDIPVERLISKDYAARCRSAIGESAAPVKNITDGDSQPPESEETTHYSIIDSLGNAVAATITLNGAYGSKVVVEGAGFLLNNEMDDFSVKPGVQNIYGLVGGKANAIAPGKRMLSSMTPTMVLREGRIFLIAGTPGGSTIITTVAQMIVDIIDFNLNPQEAVAAPRFHNQWIPDLVYHEKEAFSPPLRADLERRGHKLKERSDIGDVQLILVNERGYYGVSDPRGGGRSRGVRKIERRLN
ncbi:MAG: gamma-glutamyltransferase [Candidatus Krumholzibacteriota bacterium]|nr:gamma-glutamyltransferase [Candidatus Krumholzibacteriota bacterium]